MITVNRIRIGWVPNQADLTQGTTINGWVAFLHTDAPIISGVEERLSFKVSHIAEQAHKAIIEIEEAEHSHDIDAVDWAALENTVVTYVWTIIDNARTTAHLAWREACQDQSLSVADAMDQG